MTDSDRMRAGHTLAGDDGMTTADRQDAIETACHNAIRAMHDQAAAAHAQGRNPEACLILAGALTQLVLQGITGEELSDCMVHLTRQGSNVTFAKV